MMNRRALVLLSLLCLAAPAQGLKLIVWDRELQTKLGYGESSGTRMGVQLVGNYDGPVVVLFSQSDEERAKNSFPGLQSRYDGFLRGGQLSLQSGERLLGAQSSAAVPANGTVTLARFLSAFKMTLSGQPSSQTLSLPGLKAAGTETR